MPIRNGKYFPYGAKVKGEKQLTKDCSFIKLPEPKEVAISLSQHIGAPANPIVKVGDTVKKGQLIGEASGFVSANVYSSISGTVKDVVTKPNILGVNVNYIVIENDGLGDTVTLKDINKEDPNAIIDRVKEAGIVGLGGAGFPTFIKLSPKKPLDVLIINGAECEPYLTCDYRLMIEQPEKIIKGIEYVKKALNISTVIFAIEKNKPDAIEYYSNLGFDVVALKKQYPMGSEKHLIYTCTGRKVPVGKIPLDIGCLVENVKTLYAITEAVDDNKPLYEIFMTVSGRGVDRPKNLKVPVGTLYKEIAEFCGINDKTIKMIAGGPMMGKAIYSLDNYVKKTDSGLLFLTGEEASLSAPSNCINCGRCAKNCPMRLMPTYIEFYALAGDFKNAEKYGAMNCIECGSCAYNCPAKRALVQSISYAKAKIKELKAKEQK